MIFIRRFRLICYYASPGVVYCWVVINGRIILRVCGPTESVDKSPRMSLSINRMRERFTRSAVAFADTAKNDPGQQLTRSSRDTPTQPSKMKLVRREPDKAS